MPESLRQAVFFSVDATVQKSRELGMKFLFQKYFPGVPARAVCRYGVLARAVRRYGVLVRVVLFEERKGPSKNTLKPQSLLKC